MPRTPYLFPPPLARPTGRRFRPIAWVTLGLWLTLGATAAWADPVSDENPLYRRLSAPMSSVVEGQAWREALRGTAQRGGVNLWVDRRVDPTRPVDSGQIGPTVWACLRQLAKQRRCEVMPVGDVVLVGRGEWLDRTAAAVWRVQQAAPGRNPEKVEVAWSELTAPSEALRIASGKPAAEPIAPLPHDLWPAVRWQGIDRAAAVTLVLAQFDQQLRDPGSLESLAAAPAEASGTFTRRYAAGSADQEIERAVRQADRSGRVRRRRRWLAVTAEPAAHRAAIAAWLAGRGEHAEPPGAGAEDAPRFDLKLKNKPAGEVLGQLAATAGKPLRIDTAARRACQQLVSLEAKDTTLAELAQQVAEQAGVQVEWGEDAVVVRSAP